MIFVNENNNKEKEELINTKNKREWTDSDKSSYYGISSNLKRHWKRSWDRHRRRQRDKRRDYHKP